MGMGRKVGEAGAPLLIAHKKKADTPFDVPTP